VLEVAGDRVTAGDLARVMPVWRGLAEATPVLPAPAPYARRELGRVELERLAARHGLEPTAGEGPAHVRIERLMRPLPRAEAEAALVAALAERYRVATDDVSVELPGYTEPLVPAGEVRFRSTGMLPPAGAVAAVPLAWVTGERRSATLLLKAKLSVRGRFAVASRTLEPRAPLEPADIVFEEGPLPWPPERFRLDPKDIEGKMLMRRVAAGEKIARGWLVDRPAVERGAVVELELKRGGIELRAPARAEQTGAVGQRLAFRNLETGRRVTARVLDGKRAQVVP